MPRSEIGETLRGRPERDVHHRSGKHPEPRREEVVAEPHSGDRESVVQQVEGKDRREAREEHDLEALPRHRLVDRPESRIPSDLGAHPVAREGATHQEGHRRSEGAPDRDDDRAGDRPEEEARSQGEERAGKEKDRRRHVGGADDQCAPGPHVACPRQEVGEDPIEGQHDDADADRGDERHKPQDAQLQRRF